MFAVIKTGGKQYRVAADDVITVGKLDGEAGASVELGEVLMMGGDNGVTVGAPAIEGAKVMAEIVRHERGDKVIAFKKRRRQNSKRKRGHRQDHTVLRITAIGAEKASGEPKKRAASAKAKAKPAEAEAAEA